MSWRGKKALKSSAGRTEITTLGCTSTAQTAVKLRLTSTMIVFFTNLMHKFFILIHLLHSSTCFEHYCAHLQEDNCISTASGIVTLFRRLFSTQVSPLVTCVLNSHLKRVTIPDAVLTQLSSWRRAQYCSKHVEECNKCIKIKNLCIKLVKKERLSKYVEFCEFRLPQRSNCELRSSGLLRSE